MASTSTSSSATCFAASGWRSFQRSSPSSASCFFAALATVTSGIFDWRRPFFAPAFFFAAPFFFAAFFRREGCTRGGLALLLAVVRRPGRVALSFGLVALRELEQRLERADGVVDPGAHVAALLRSGPASSSA